MRLGASGLIEVVSPFDPVTAAQLRTIRPAGRWHARDRCWQFPLEAAAVLRTTLNGRFPLTPELRQWCAWLDQPLPPLPPHGRLVAAATLDAPLEDGRCLFSHQRVGARWLLARRGAVLADAMGLGKTLTALAAARALVRLADCRVVVVAPAGLHHHWHQEACALGLTLDLHSWARLPAELPPAGCVLLADEAHYAQTLTARRTKALLRLARHPRLRAAWLLTGTPMKNGRPVQLFPLLAAIGHPLATDQRHFEERYCQGHWRERQGSRQWEARGASQLDELHRFVRPLVLLRRKEQCLDLPPKQRRLHAVVLPPLEAEALQRQLEQAVAQYRQRAAMGLVRGDAETLAVFTALRQISSRAKVAAVASHLAALLAEGEPVVVFTAFVATARALLAALTTEGSRPVLLTGGVPPGQRQGLVDAFQRGRRSALIATYGTGGLGFTLHRARHVVLVERPWTPGEAEQAEDRCHRIGMGASLTSHWFQLGAADQLVDGLVASKADRISDVFTPARARARRDFPQRIRQWLESC
ncbi:MAG: DEAD/DEAH box helicase [Cyanobacteriota bacterium]|nr:DEAD/DEAH box helicase [Cyanobacteriota bacterium]